MFVRAFKRVSLSERNNSCNRSSIEKFLFAARCSRDALKIARAAKEMNRVVIECKPEKNKIDLSLLEHVSPITWDNVILYGESM